MLQNVWEVSFQIGVMQAQRAAKDFKLIVGLLFTYTSQVSPYKTTYKIRKFAFSTELIM